MLVLNRRLNQTVCVGDKITLTVLAIKGGRVRLGITAPRDVPVHREEIYLRIQQEEKDSDGKDDESE